MSRRPRAAVGFAGAIWVTLAGDVAAPHVLDRRTFSVRDGQPYHLARTLPARRARAEIERAARRACSRAVSCLETIRDEAASRGFDLDACGVALGSFVLPATLEATLASHPACHAAEGEMSRDAVTAACEALPIRVVGAPERDLAAQLGRHTADPEGYVAELRRVVGAPWQRGHRTAAMAAWLALLRTPGMRS